MSLMLVAELPMFSLKFKNLSFAKNKTRFLFLVLSLILMAVFNLAGIPLIILWYILLSILNTFGKKN
jgi:CDP-diacylglycerol--serine O-phosphatidyltransferase